MKSWTSLTTHVNQTQSTVMSSVSKGTSYKGQVVCLPGSYCKMVVKTLWRSFLSVTTCLCWQSGTRRNGDSSTWARISSWKTQDVPCLALSWNTRWQLLVFSISCKQDLSPLFRLQIVEKSKYPLPVSNLAPSFGSDSIQVMREEEAFSFGSLVADCGGVLGLFIGFNFIMIWDWIVITLTRSHLLSSLLS